MMSRRVFLRRALLGGAAMASLPVSLRITRPPLLWIADHSPAVTATLQLLAQHHELAETWSFSCKQQAIASLRSQTRKPTLLITDFFGGSLRGDEFIGLARTVAPSTKLILFSSVVGDLKAWRAITGPDAPTPGAIIEKPNTQKLLTVVEMCILRRRLIEI